MFPENMQVVAAGCVCFIPVDDVNVDIEVHLTHGTPRKIRGFQKIFWGSEKIGTRKSTFLVHC